MHIYEHEGVYYLLLRAELNNRFQGLNAPKEVCQNEMRKDKFARITISSLVEAKNTPRDEPAQRPEEQNATLENEELKTQNQNFYKESQQRLENEGATA